MAGDPVLIVEDNAVSVKVLRLLLASEGYVIHTASSAEEALTLLESIMPRLILMDIQLPGMNGLELTRRLKADPARRHIPILALTAYAMKGDCEKAMAAGCDGYICKPISTRALPGTVAQTLQETPPPSEDAP